MISEENSKNMRDLINDAVNQIDPTLENRGEELISKHLTSNYIHSVDMMKQLTDADWNHIQFPIAIRIVMQQKWASKDQGQVLDKGDNCD